MTHKSFGGGRTSEASDDRCGDEHIRFAGMQSPLFGASALALPIGVEYHKSVCWFKEKAYLQGATWNFLFSYSF